MEALTPDRTGVLPGLVGMAEDGTITTFSTTAAHLLGFREEDLVGRPFHETLLPPRMRDNWAELLTVHAGVDEPMTVWSLTATGEERSFMAMTIDIGPGPTRYLSCFWPLTDGAADVRPPSDEGVGGFSVDDPSDRVELSETLWRAHGLEGSPRPFTLLEYLETCVHPGDHAKVRGRRERRRDTPPWRVDLDWRIVRPDGEVRRLAGDGWASYGDDGTLSRAVGAARDVTDSEGAALSLEAHRAVDAALSGWSDQRGGLVGVLRGLTLALGWLCGGLWVRADDSDTLVCRAFWMRPEQRPSEIETSTRSADRRIGSGPLGLAWASGEVTLSGAGAEAAPAADSMAAVPIVRGGDTIAVIGFRPARALFVAPVLRETLGEIGRGRLAEFCAAHRAELGISPLTERERQVLQLAADGGAIHTIAAELGISSSTVKTHFEHIYRKLDVSDRGSGVAEGFRQGLIS